MRTTCHLFTLLLLFSLSGCNQVTVKEPFGDPLPREELEKFIGTWVGEEEEMVGQFQLTDDNRLIFGGLEWKSEENRFEIVQFAITPRKSGDDLYAFVHDSSKRSQEEQEKVEEVRYLLARYRFVSDDEIHASDAKVQVFERATNSKKLKGRVEKKKFSTDVHLDATAEEILAFISEEGVEICFEKIEGPFLKRLKNKEMFPNGEE